MKMITLAEDTPSKDSRILYEHGLSVYVESEKHHLLLDTGATDAFAANAKTLGVDLKSVDTVVLSHGHYDHSGGIIAFSRINPNAQIYMQKTAAQEHCRLLVDGGEKNIGIDPEIVSLPQVKMMEGDYNIDESLFVFTGVIGRKLWPKGNMALKLKQNGSIVQDDFCHEQYLVISEHGKNYLLSGCAHNGILNIIEAYKERFGGFPNAVVSGFHMIHSTPLSREDISDIEETAKELAKMPTVFYTGHCTGQEAYDIMKPILGEKLKPIHSGEIIFEQ